MAHVKQMVHVRPQCSNRYHLAICPTMVPRLIFQGKECLQPRGNNLPARCFSRIQWEIKHWAQDWDWSIIYQMYSHKQLSSWVLWRLEFSCKRTILWRSNRGLLQNMAAVAKRTTITMSRQCQHGQGNPKQAHVYGPRTVFHGHLYWWQCFHFLCWRKMTVSLSHILFLVSGFV